MVYNKGKTPAERKMGLQKRRAYNRTKEMVLLALLAAMITITGLFKIPGIVPGTEFQLSAPVAVAIAAAFGFRRYLISGVLSSLVSLALGLQTIFNVIVAMTFRVVAGSIIAIFGNWFLILIVAGPIGTFCGRIALALITQTNLWALTAAAAPGMGYTAVAAYPAYRLLIALTNLSGFGEFLVPRRILFRTKKQQQKRRNTHEIQRKNAGEPDGKR